MPYSRYIFGHLPWYSVLIVSGIVTAVLYAIHEEKRLGLPKDTIVDLALWVIPFGVIGARLYYVLFSWEYFADDFLSVFAIWNGGIAIYGGIIGGLIAVICFACKRKISFLTLTDMIVPGLALAQCIGRWGNFFNMEAYGLPITKDSLQFFPIAVFIPEQGWFMATFFYESVWNLLVFSALHFFVRTSKQGLRTSTYLLLYASGRLIIEGFRSDSLMLFDRLRVSQVLSLVICFIGLIGILLLHRPNRFKPSYAALLSAVCILLGYAFVAGTQHPLHYSIGMLWAAFLILYGKRSQKQAMCFNFLCILDILILVAMNRCHLSSLCDSTVRCLIFSLTALYMGATVFITHRKKVCP